MTATIRTYSEHFPWLIPDGNSSFRDIIVGPSRFNMSTEKTPEFKDHGQEPSTHRIDNQQNYSSGAWADSKVVVVARISDYDNETEGEWAIVAEPKERNDTLNLNWKNSSVVRAESDDYFLGNDDVQKYLNDYQDLLYTFKDFVKIGAIPNKLQNNISQYASNENHGKVFNVTYVMPIPKTKKYFEIKLSNLTKIQYNEINKLLQIHLLKKQNSTEVTQIKEHETVYVDEDIKGNSLISRSLSDQALLSQTSKPVFQNGRFPQDIPSTNEQKTDYFKPLLNPEGFNYFLNNFESIHIDLNNKSVDETVFQPSVSPPTIIQNNGFHAEIATDYVKKYDANGKNNVNKEDSSSHTNHYPGDSSGPYEQLGSGRSILIPNPRRNRTKLFPQTRSKRPILNAPHNLLNTRKRKTSPSGASVSEQPMTEVDSSTSPPIPSNNTLLSNIHHIDILSNPYKDESLEITSLNKHQNSNSGNTNKDRNILEKNTTASIGAQDWLELYQVHKDSKDEIPKPVHVMQAAEWLIDMKRKIDEEDRRKTERIKNYIKQYLRGGEGSIFLAEGNSSNVMKINKQENILEELKLLMLDYFTSLNFETQEATSGNTSSATELIFNASNIFELMEHSSQLVKSNLNIKLQSETREPSKFVKRIAEKQVEKCKRAFGKRPFTKDKETLPGTNRKSGYRRYMAFTNCMNLRLKRCIKGFSLWLEKGKFYLRPQFKLGRAYENYEIERNLYCLRSYDPSSLSSNPHGVKVKPGPKVNRKSGPGKVGTRKNKQRFSKKANEDNKLRTRQDNIKPARLNVERTRRFKQHQISRRPKVQRYSDQQGEDVITKQN